MDAMKDLAGSAGRTVPVPPTGCYALLSDVERYPEWYPDVVTSVEALERDPGGDVSRAQAVLHVALGRLVHDFNLRLAVERDPERSIVLQRIPRDASDEQEFRVAWALVPEGSGTRIELQLGASLPIPRFVPTGGIGQTMADGFVTAAAGAVTRNQ